MFLSEKSVVQTLSNTELKILAVKVQLPNLPLHSIHREHVLNTIKANEHCRVHLFKAGSGYGKTMVLAQWFQQLQQQDIAVSWLTLDAKENDCYRFITYLASALHGVHTDISSSTLSMLEDGKEINTIMDELIHGLNQYGKPLHMAFDNIDCIVDKECIDFIRRLLSYVNQNIVIYFLSSKALPFSLSEFYAQGLCASYDESNLALSKSEVAIWSEQQNSQILSTQPTSWLYELSGGWFTGLWLIKQAVEQKGECLIDGSEQLLTDYFHENWQCHLTQEQFESCFNLALLESACAQYLDYVFATRRSHVLLDQLHRDHYHVVTSCSDNHEYWLHPLLRLFLLNQWNKSSMTEPLNRACQWLSVNGFDFQAVDMALRMHNVEQASNLLDFTAEKTFEQYNLKKLLQWHQQLPENVIVKSPKLVIIFSWALALSQQFEEAERLLAKMDSRRISLDIETRHGLSGQLFAIRGYIARCRGKMKNAIQLCEQALDKLDSRHLIAKSITYFNLSNIYLSQDKLDKAREFNRLSYESARSKGNIHLEMQAIHEHARIEQVRGNLNLADKHLNQGLLLAKNIRQSDLAAPYGRLLIYKGYIAWLKNNLKEAESLLQRGIQITQSHHDSYIIMGYVLKSNIARHTGDIEVAYDLLSEVESILQYWSVPGFIYQPWLKIMRVNLQIDEGKIDVAIKNLRALNNMAAQHEFALSPEHYPGLKHLCDVFYVRAKSISGQHGKALTRLDHTFATDSDSQQGFSLVFNLLMRALLRYQLGQENDALSDFRRAIVMAEPNHCIMPFIEYSESMHALYDKLPKPFQEKTFIKTILSNIKNGEESPHNHGFARIHSVISQREMAVLLLIAEGLTNQDIAERLFISLHTVKTHARRINSKLGVKSRTQAIIKAREMGFI